MLLAPAEATIPQLVMTTGQAFVGPKWKALLKHNINFKEYLLAASWRYASAVLLV